VEPAGLGDEFDELFSEISEVSSDSTKLPELDELAPLGDANAAGVGEELQGLDALLEEVPTNLSVSSPAVPEISSDVDAGNLEHQLDELNSLLSDDSSDASDDGAALPSLESLTEEAAGSGEDLEDLFADLLSDDSDASGKQS